jgi:hypothetical protein
MPGQELLREGWQEDIFTYTWVRDAVFLPGQRFYAQMRLGAEEQAFLLSKFCEELPPLVSHQLSQIRFAEKKISVAEWRKIVLDAAPRLFEDKIDPFLYQALPIIPGKEWKASVRRILSDLMNDEVEKIFQQLPAVHAPFLMAAEVRSAAKGCYLLAQKKLTLPLDLHHYVAKHARFVGVAAPTPLLFADTNWANYCFGFVVNPGNGRFELWRLDRTASYGVQMTQWKPMLNGTVRRPWAIFTRPFEYTQFDSNVRL